VADLVRVLWSQSETSRGLVRSVGRVLAPYPAEDILHVSHSVVALPTAGVVAGAGINLQYSALIVVRDRSGQVIVEEEEYEEVE
jgi:hypothetical protein